MNKKTEFGMKKIIIGLLLVVTTITSWAYDFSAVAPSGQILYYGISGNVAYVTYENPYRPSYSILSGALEIPSSVTYNGATYSVTGIGDYAFEYCRGLTSVTIPSSVTSIGDRAFDGCSGLTSVTIPSSVTSIGSYAFSFANLVNYCGSAAGSPWGATRGGCFYEEGDFIYEDDNKTTILAYIGNGGDVIISNSVTSIGDRAFDGCSGLTSVTIPNSVTSIGYSAFSGCSGLTSVTIPNSVTSIGYSAFSGCSGLTSVTIPNSVTSIGYGAFYGCSGLTSITIPNSVITISEQSFEGCNSLTSVTIPNSVTSIGGNAFSGCSGLTNVTIPNSVTRIGGEAFSNCSGLTSVTIPSSVTSIEMYAFKDCSSLSCVVFYAADCTYMGSQVFSGCNNLSSLTIGETVTKIPDNAFSGCSGLTSVTIGNSVTSIGYSAFSGCSGLTSVTIPNSVTSIGVEAFFNCSGLTNVTIGNSVTSIGGYAFGNCSSLSCVVFYAADCTYMGSPFFSGCNNLSSLTIGETVTKIPDYAFYGCSGLTSVTIGNSVTSIGYYAFSGCGNVDTLFYNSRNLTTTSSWSSSSYGFRSMKLKHLVIGDSVQTLPSYVFYYQDSLTSVTIPNSVTSIGGAAFYGCSGLTNVTIPNSVTSIGGYAFNGCSGLTSVTIPNSVTSIGDYAFNGCSGLTSVTIPNSVTCIRYSAFSGCSDLTNVTIPNSVTSIGSYAFKDCSSLSSVAFYATDCTTMGSVESPVFSGCNNLSSLTIGETVTKIPDYAFYGRSGLTSVTIPNSVTSIGDDAFTNCRGLTNVTIGNSLTSIGNSAFYGCSGLTSVTIPNSVTSIGGYAFNGCSGLTNVTIPNSVTSIGGYAFKNCSSLSSVAFYAADCTTMGSAGSPVFSGCNNLSSLTIGETVTKIPDYAFYGCSGLTSVTIPNSVTSIGGAAFYGCSGLTNVTIGNSLTSIGNSAFYGCSGLTSVTIPNSVTSIGDYAFNGCSGLTNVTIPNSVTSIGGYAFNGCSGLTSVTIPNSVTSIGDYAFNGCSGLTSVTIPNSVTSIGYNAFSGCSGLTSVTIPNSVTSIGSYAFFVCSGLTSVIIPDSVNSIGYSAFKSCRRLTSVVFNAAHCTTMGNNTDPVFAECDSLVTLTIGESVTVIPDYAFRGCSSLTSVIIPNSVTSIGNSAFYGCSGLTRVAIGNSLNSIGAATFSGCTGLSEIVSESDIAPAVSSSASTFGGIPANTPILIPCGASTSYLSRWPYFSNFVEAEWYQVSVSSEDSTRGYVSIMTQPTCTAPDGIIFAVANPGFVFDHWTDGVTNNPRNFTLCQDTLFEAVFVQSVVPDRYSVSVLPSNVAYGSITGGGVYDVNTQAHLEAIPNYGYHFVRWSDDQTQNPRTITVQSDTMFAALFAPNTYSVFAYPSNPSMGSTSGGGTMEYLSSITIEAAPSLGCHFVSWSDSVADNPRVMVVSRDSVLIAQFEYDQYMVAGNPTSDSTGTIVGIGTYMYNAQVVLMAIPNAHYHFVAWSDGVSSVNRTVTITSDTAFFAIFAIDTHQVNVVTSNALMGAVFGSGEYAYGANISLSAIPNYGYHFVQWSDGDLSNPKNLPVLNDVSLIALFAPNNYMVSITSSDTVMGYASGSGEFEYLSICSIYAVSNYGYHFVQWSDGSTMNPRSVVVDRDSSVMAIFAPDVFWIRTGVNDPSMGAVSNDANVNYLSQIVLTATPYDHCHFVQWNDGSTTNPRTLTVVGDSSFTAFFEREPSYLVVVNSNDLNRGSVSGSGTFYIGEKDTMYAEAYEHYYFSHWSDGNTNNPRVVIVLGDAAYTAVFEGEIVDVATSVNNTLMGSVSGGGEYHYGDIVTLVANPKEGYHFMQWSDGSTANPYMFTAYESMSIEAQFGSNEGIDGVEWDYGVNSRGNEIIIYGVSGRKVQVYDISGRRIAYIDKSNDTEFIAVPARGVYMVKVGDTPARKVVVM